MPRNWVIGGVGDFNGDGKADILWHNTATGDVDVWEMNGTSIIAAAGLGNPGATCTPVGTGDYNGDGKADILFQNTDGTPMIWTMNGTTVTATTTLTDPGTELARQDRVTERRRPSRTADDGRRSPPKPAFSHDPVGRGEILRPFRETRQSSDWAPERHM